MDRTELLQFATNALEFVKSPWGPSEIIGKPFVFGDEAHFVIGTITSVGYGPREGVVLYVSAPRYRGMDIWRFSRKHNEWVAWGKPEEHADKSNMQARTGTFVLL